MLREALALFVSLGLVRGACHNATSVNGVTSALCVDEATGFEFEFRDYEGRFPLSGLATPDMLSAMYADYRNENEGPDANSTSGKSNTLMGQWVKCGPHHIYDMEGVCADDHVIRWTGDSDKFQRRMHFMLSKIDKNRMVQDPRAFCVKWSNAGTICVQWTYKVEGTFADGQMWEMGGATWLYCQYNKFSTELKLEFKNIQAKQYFCISDRSTGCVPNSVLELCPSLRTGSEEERWGHDQLIASA